MTLAQFFNIFLIAIALAMDSFTVAISGGASLKNVTKKTPCWSPPISVFFKGP